MWPTPVPTMFRLLILTVVPSRLRSGSAEIPAWPACRPTASTVVVTNRADNSVSIIDAARLAVRSAINVCIHPEDIAILPDSSKAFVSCSGSGQVASIALKNQTQNDKLLALLDVGKSPVSLALKPDGGELVAFNFEAGSISIIETTGNEVSGSYLIGAQPTRGVVSLDNSRLYISNFGSNNIAVYDIDLGKVIAYLPVGTHPDALALSRIRTICWCSTPVPETWPSFRNARRRRNSSPRNIPC